MASESSDFPETSSFSDQRFDSIVLWGRPDFLVGKTTRRDEVNCQPRKFVASDDRNYGAGFQLVMGLPKNSWISLFSSVLGKYPHLERWIMNSGYPQNLWNLPFLNKPCFWWPTHAKSWVSIIFELSGFSHFEVAGCSSGHPEKKPRDIRNG